MTDEQLTKAKSIVQDIKNGTLSEKIIEETADKMIEVWKTTTVSSNYLISNLGRAISLKHGLLKPTANSRGYLEINIDNKHCKIHRLVAMAFIPNVENKDCINHIDGNPLNNRLDNLEWVTSSENLSKKFQGKKLFKRSVQELDENNEVIRTFNSIRECERYHSMTKDSLRDFIRSGRVINGSHYRYVEG